MQVFLDIETTGDSRFNNNISIFGLFVPQYNYFVILNNQNCSLLDYNNPDSVDYSEFYESIKQELFTLPKDTQFITCDGKFSTLFLYHKTGFTIEPSEDVMLEQYVLHMDNKKPLSYIVKQELNEEFIELTNKQKSIPNGESLEYFKKKLVYIYRCHNSLRKKISENSKFERLYTKLVLPSYKAYKEIEKNGIYFNESKYHQVYREYQNKLSDLESDLKSIKNINWGSSKQLSDFLYNELSFPVVEKTEKGTPSTDSGALKKLVDKGYSLAEKILEYRFYKQAVNTFLKPWGEQIHNHRIYPTFNIDSVRTGRTSSCNPNLQQVPKDINLRSLFTAPKGYNFYEIDHSQLELRVASHIMNEPSMIQAYLNNEDLHTKTAKSIVGHEPSKQERAMAKPVNFGFLYGMSAKTFPEYAFKNYGQHYTLEQGEQFRNAFFNTYPKLLEYYKTQENKCIENGGAWSLFGRFRSLPDLYSINWSIKHSAIKQAINTPTQSTGSDILVSGMIEIINTFSPSEVKVVGTVHDSILLEIRADNKEQERYKQVISILENPKLLKTFDIKLKVPLKVDGSSCGNEKIGTGWGVGH